MKDRCIRVQVQRSKIKNTGCPAYGALPALFCLLLLQGLFFPHYGWSEELTAVAVDQATQPSLITEARETASLISSILKVVGSLALVLGLMLLLLHLLKRFGIGKGKLRHGPLIKILDTCMIAPKKQVTLLEIGGEYVAIGVTDQQINLLTKLEDTTKLNEAVNKNNSGNGRASSSSPFAAVFDKAVHGAKKNKEQF